MRRPLTALLRRDLAMARRQGTDTALGVGFFLLVAAIFVFGVGPDPQTAALVAPGVVWVAALLATLLSLDRLFQADFDDGSLEQLVIAGPSLVLTVGVKAFAQWLTAGLPLIVLSPVLALILQLPGERLVMMLLALLVGTPVLTLIGAVGAALVLGARRGGALLSLLILPLYIPVLIFGVGAVQADGRSALLFLAALLLAALALAPWAAAAAVRQALE